MGELGQVTSCVGTGCCLPRRKGGRIPSVEAATFGRKQVLVGGLARERVAKPVPGYGLVVGDQKLA